MRIKQNNSNIFLAQEESSSNLPHKIYSSSKYSWNSYAKEF